MKEMENKHKVAHFLCMCVCALGRCCSQRGGWNDGCIRRSEESCLSLCVVWLNRWEPVWPQALPDRLARCLPAHHSLAAVLTCSNTSLNRGEGGGVEVPAGFESYRSPWTALIKLVPHARLHLNAWSVLTSLGFLIKFHAYFPILWPVFIDLVQQLYSVHTVQLF